jgi:hypothetical protein
LQFAGTVLGGEGKRLDGAGGLPVFQAASQVGLNACRTLVAVVGIFGHELKHQVRQYLGDGWIELSGGDRRLSQMAVDQFQDVVGGKRQSPCQELVEGDPQGVEVGAVVEGAIHAPGLFGRAVGQGAFQLIGGVRGRFGLRELGGDAEVNQLDLSGGGVQDDVAGVDVFVDHLAAVDLADNVCHLKGQFEELWRLHGAVDLGPLVHPVAEGFAAEVFADNDVGVVVRQLVIGPNYTGQIEALQYPVFLPVAGNLLGAGILIAQHLQHH